MQEAAHARGVDKTQVVKVCNRTYPHWEEKEVEFIMTGVSYMDISAAQELLELVKRLKDDNVKFRFTGVTQSVELMMKRSGISDIIS